tara:strand:- start:920 stop:1288 length:369 start_codon:yes stop_codon:yes gene_type:complete
MPTEEEDMMRSIVSSVSLWETRLVRRRISTALQEKKQQGFKLGKAPFGYDMVNGKLVENPEQMPTRRRIEELRDEGIGWNKIARTLNAEGRPTQKAKGQGWYASTVFNMIERSTVNLDGEEV